MGSDSVERKFKFTSFVYILSHDRDEKNLMMIMMSIRTMIMTLSSWL